ncbi:GbsR/MarR family transcriptional regulator [Sciscionella marina]|uniref:GbsR/MarR family transcriptional regulator n=1 Tax=Sciscionella marina TaxID=508770 RepID=UPI000475CC35|nr:MarR family transcriptional regulator [Sciscionella marina]
MPTDDELTFADHMGRFYARRYSMPPMAGRLVGYLAVTHPRAHSISELAEALLASRSAITGAIKVLENLYGIERTRAAGERMDRIRLDINSSAQAAGFDIAEYQELGEMAREGLKVLGDAPTERRAVLLEMAALADFLVERMPTFYDEWLEHRQALRAAGELPDAP